MKKSNTKEKDITLTARRAVALWNLVFDRLLPASDKPAFSGWWKRVCVYLQPETETWNKMSSAEREALGDYKITVPVNRLPAQHLPPIIEKAWAEALKPVVEGEIKLYKGRLADQLEKHRKKVKDNE